MRSRLSALVTLQRASNILPLTAAAQHAGWWTQQAAAATASSSCGGPQWLRLMQQCKTGSRGFMSDTREQQQTRELQQFLDSVQATKLRGMLEAEAHVRPFMPFGDLLAFIKQQGAADTDGEAQQRADALVRAGLVLRFNNVVYLRPAEVAQLVTRTLPTDPELSRACLASVEAQLSELDQQYKQLQDHAQRWPRFWLRAGCAVVAAQLGGFYYFTYYELSWDVMEPVAYLLTLTYTLLAYVYFLATRGSSFDLQPFQDYWTERQLEKKLAERGFDMEAYKHLLRTRECHRQYLDLSSSKAKQE